MRVPLFGILVDFIFHQFSVVRSSGDEMLTPQHLWQSSKRKCSGRRLLAARAAALPWGCAARSKALLALGLHFTSPLGTRELATPQDGQQNHDPSSVTTNTEGTEDAATSTKPIRNQVRFFPQKCSRHDRLVATMQRQRLEAGMSALFEAATCFSSALKAEVWRPVLGAALGPYDGRLCNSDRAHNEPPPTLLGSALGFITLATLAQVLDSNNRPLLAHRILTLCAAAAPITATLPSPKMLVTDPILVPNHILPGRNGHRSRYLWLIRRRHLAKRALLEERLGAALLGLPSLYAFLADLSQRKSAATLVHVAIQAATSLALSNQPCDALDILRRTECALMNRVSNSSMCESQRNSRSNKVPQSVKSAAAMPISSSYACGVAFQAGREYEIQISSSNNPTSVSHLADLRERCRKTQGANSQSVRSTNSSPEQHTTGGAPPDGRGLEMLDTTPRTTQRITYPESRRKVPETFMLDIFLDGFLGLNSFDEGTGDLMSSPQISSTESIAASSQVYGSDVPRRDNSMAWAEDRVVSDWIIGCAGVAYGKVDERFMSSNASDDDTDSEREEECLPQEPATALWLYIRRIRYELVTAYVACGKSYHAVSLLESMLSQDTVSTAVQSPKSSTRNDGCWPRRRTSTSQRRSMANQFSVDAGKGEPSSVSLASSDSSSIPLPRVHTANRRALLSWLARAKLDTGNSRGARTVIAELRAIDATHGGTPITNHSCSKSGFFESAWGFEGGYGAAAFGDCGEIEARAWVAEGHVAAALDSLSQTIASVEDTLHVPERYVLGSNGNTCTNAALLEELAKLSVLRGRIALEGAQSLPPNAFPLVLADDASTHSRRSIAKQVSVKSAKTRAMESSSNRTRSKLRRQPLSGSTIATASGGIRRGASVKKPSAASTTVNAGAVESDPIQKEHSMDGVLDTTHDHKNSKRSPRQHNGLPQENDSSPCGNSKVLTSPSELLHNAACSLRRAGAAAAAAGVQSGGNRGGAVSAEAALLLASVAVAAAFEPVLLYRIVQDPCDPKLAQTPLDFAAYYKASSTKIFSAASGDVNSVAGGSTPPGVHPLNVSPPPPPLNGDSTIWTLAETQRAATHGLAGAVCLGEPLLHFEALVIDAEVGGDITRFLFLVRIRTPVVLFFLMLYFVRRTFLGGPFICCSSCRKPRSNY